MNETTSPKDAMASFQAGLTAILPNPESAKPSVIANAAHPKSDAPSTPEPQAPATPTVPTGDDKIPRTSQEWKKFTVKRDADMAERDKRIAAAEARAADLESKLKAGVASPELDRLNKDLDAIRKERDDYDERLKVVAITQHPKFRKEFESRLAGQINLAKSIVAEEHKEAVERILGLPEGKFKDARVEELMAEMGSVQVARFGAILNNVTEINQDRNDIIANAKTEYEKLTAAQSAQTKSNLDRAEAELHSSLARAGEHPLYKKNDDQSWNQDVDQRLQQAEQLARNPIPIAESTRIILNHLALPAVQKQLDSSKSENEKLRAQISDLTSATPGIVSRTRDANIDEGGGTPVRIQQGSNPMNAAREWMKSLPKVG